MAKKNYEPEVVHISAEEGQPSTFWKGANGKYYTKKSDAIQCNSNGISDISRYEKRTPFLRKYKKYILAGTVAAIVVAAKFYFIPKYIKH